MESQVKIDLQAPLLKNIRHSESESIDILECLADTERIEIALFFFKLIRDLNIDIKIKEKTLRLYDLVNNLEEYDLVFKKVFLISFLQISLKISENRQRTKEIISKVIDLLKNQTINDNKESKENTEENNKTLTQDNISINIEELNMTEILLLNKLDWKFNIFLICDYVSYFMDNYFNDVKSYINEKPLKLIIDLLTECTLTAFHTKTVSVHYLAISIILIALDQFIFLSNYEINLKPLIKNFLKKCFEKFGVDLLQVDNYKKLLLEFVDLFDCKITKVSPDENIKELNCIKNFNDILVKKF